MAFDVEGAKKAGYTDSEIADHLAQSSSFDAAGARSSGYSDADIIGHLSGAAPSQQSAPSPASTGQPASKLTVPKYDRGMEGVRSALRGATIGVSDVLGAAGGAAGY